MRKAIEKGFGLSGRWWLGAKRQLGEKQGSSGQIYRKASREADNRSHPHQKGKDEVQFATLRPGRAAATAR